jgi:tRNA-dihydrouridine synthase
MTNIWNELPRPFFILAPMEAVTDVVFRHVVTKAARPDIYFTEFTNATGWVAAGDRAIGGRLVKTDDESPLIAQLWGAEPEAMAKLAAHCRDLGYDGIDINMGCPDASAVKSGGGSGMIRTPELAAEMIAAAKTAGLPVSVKTRLGYSRVDEWQDWLTHILKQDIVNLTIHLRTKKEMSKVDAHFELIPDIKQLRDNIAPQTLLTINGDIRDRAHGEELVRHYGVDGVMIGRGIFHNPFAFEAIPAAHSREELLCLLRLQLDLHDKYSAEFAPRKFEPLKRFFKIYIRNFDGASELRDTLMHTKSTEEVRDVLAKLK